jgi:hypothetical protein
MPTMMSTTIVDGDRHARAAGREAVAADAAGEETLTTTTATTPRRRILGIG